MPIIFNGPQLRDDACCGPSTPFVPAPTAYTCCPCETPFEGTPIAGNFCYPTTNPFTTAQSGGVTMTAGAESIVAVYSGSGNGVGSAVAPSPVIRVLGDGFDPTPFCFCAVMSQNRIVTDAHSWAFVGLDSGAGKSLGIATTADLGVGLPTATYQLITYNSTGPVANAYDTGVPIDGTKHKFQVCWTETPGELSLVIDDGTPVLVNTLTLWPVVTLTPSISLSATVSATHAFRLTVDSYCAAAVLF